MAPLRGTESGREAGPRLRSPRDGRPTSNRFSTASAPLPTFASAATCAGCALHAAARRFAAMTRIPVNVLEQGQQFVAKDLVIMRPSKAAAVAKVDELDAAMGALGVAEDRFSGFDGGFGLALGRRRGILHVLLSAVLAEMQFFE